MRFEVSEVQLSPLNRKQPHSLLPSAQLAVQVARKSVAAWSVAMILASASVCDDGFDGGGEDTWSALTPAHRVLRRFVLQALQ
jgi:hypothetical protein